MNPLQFLSCEECTNRPKSLFSCLSAEEARQLDPIKTMRHFKRRELVFTSGKKPSGLFCMSSGYVKVFQTGLDGREQIVRLSGPGEILGYRALLSGEEYVSSAQVLQDSRMCFFDKWAFFQFMENKIHLMRRIMEWLCQDLRTAEERLRQLAQKPVRERLAETLLILGKTFGKSVKMGIKIEIRLTRQEIAELAGTVLETTVRHLSEFKRQKLIRFEGKCLILCDEAGLRKIARQN